MNEKIKPAAAQEAVWELAKKVRTELDRASCPDAFMRIAVEAVMEHAAAPVAAAPAVSVETLRALSDRWATDRSYTGSPIDDIRALIEQPTMSTPAAPGVDLEQFKDLIGFAAWSAINLPETDPRRDFIRQASELLALIDASPKGWSTSDCPIIRLAPGEYTDWEKRVWRRGVIECATQSDIAAAMQATSAEVGA